MIKLKNILYEAPDIVWTAFGNLHFRDPNARSIFFHNNSKLLVGGNGENHNMLIKDNLNLLMKDIHKAIFALSKASSHPYFNRTNESSVPEDFDEFKKKLKDRRFLNAVLDDAHESLIQYTNALTASGRYWVSVGDDQISVFSFWIYPKTKAQLMTIIRNLNLDADNSFVELPSEKLVSANDYKAPSNTWGWAENLLRNHRLPPHLR